MVTLIAFASCPEAPRIVRLLEEAGIAFDYVDPERLPSGHPFGNYTSPTLLWNQDILLGSRTDGAVGCALGLPTDDAIRSLLKIMQS